ncbi:MAG: heme A synthase [Acidimicrobiaceae bacterium]|nr:heme A synthase [Acidimicrobiaceae bacterium]
MTVTSRRDLSPAVFRWFAFSAFISMILIILTGAAVRLTGSGLGCPDWPTCFRHSYATGWTIHSKIEFANRLVTVTLVVLTLVVFLASFARRPRRRDLSMLAGMLIGGVILDAVLGAYVVYSKLNPWLVSLHLLLSLAMVVIAAILYHRSKYIYGPGARADVRDPHFRTVARLLWIPFVVLLLTGTMTTGSGPHSGGSQGQLEARRLPFAFSSAAWVHSLAATLFVGLIVGLLITIWRTSAPAPLQMGVRRLVIISLVQAVIGVTQYLTHVPAALVELHVAGATSLTIGMTQFHLRQSAHDREPTIAKS